MSPAFKSSTSILHFEEPTRAGACLLAGFEPKDQNRWVHAGFECSKANNHASVWLVSEMTKANDVSYFEVRHLDPPVSGTIAFSQGRSLLFQAIEHSQHWGLASLL
jgi:hypothetical protein